MNFQIAGIASGAFFALSLLMGLIGGVGIGDLILRALFWAVFGFGGSLGIEFLLRSMVPDLFSPSETADQSPTSPDAEATNPGPRVVDIIVEEEPVRNFREPPAADVNPPVGASHSESTDEPMPEIGSFLDAFKPGADAAPESSEEERFTPSPLASAATEVTFEGEVQDPAVLAKAVQTVMKRDAQGT